MTELCYGSVLRNHITQIPYSIYVCLCNGKYTLAYAGIYGIYIYILRLIYYGICVTPQVTQHKYVLRHIYIYYARYIMADILRQLYYGGCITAITEDILRQIYYGRYYGTSIMADILRAAKTAISRQIYSARSSSIWLLHPHLLVATHRPKDAPWLLYVVYVEITCPRRRPQTWVQLIY